MADKEPQKVCVSSLPFYGEVPRPSYAARPEEDSVLRDGFRVAREGVTEVVGVARDTRDAVNHVVDTGKAHSSAAYFQLREEENLPARLAIMSGTGLLGLLVGRLRGGLFKRVLYTGLGAGAGAAFCHPDEASELSSAVYQEGGKAAQDAYSLVTGVKSEEEVMKNSLIASSISRSVRFLMRRLKEMKDAIKGSE